MSKSVKAGWYHPFILFNDAFLFLYKRLIADDRFRSKKPNQNKPNQTNNQ